MIIFINENLSFNYCEVKHYMILKQTENKYLI